MNVDPLSVADIDERLMACRAAYFNAMETDDFDSADAMYAAMDDLLDRRCHIPLQRSE
jgi:hypothetical protein